MDPTSVCWFGRSRNGRAGIRAAAAIDEEGVGGASGASEVLAALEVSPTSCSDERAAPTSPWHAVAVKLDRLPLALEQASTYLDQTGEQLANSAPVARLTAITKELLMQWVKISLDGAPPLQRQSGPSATSWCSPVLAWSHRFLKRYAATGS
jgi:hypothetical protein